MGEKVAYPSGEHICEGIWPGRSSGAGPRRRDPEWWGLVPHVMDLCDRFAKEGFVAVAPTSTTGRRPPRPTRPGGS